MADGGARLLFADLHPEVRYADETLWIDMPVDAAPALEGRGLLLVPSAFMWPSGPAFIEPPWQATLLYPARGISSLWEPAAATVPEALAAPLGPRRATVLAALDSPRSTTELARALRVSAASVSQHLSVLRDAGLANRQGVGRVVLCVRSPIGEDLVRRA